MSKKKTVETEVDVRVGGGDHTTYYLQEDERLLIVQGSPDEVWRARRVLEERGIVMGTYMQVIGS